VSTATQSDDELLASLEPGSFAVFYRRHVEDLVAFSRAGPATPSLPPI
jgi:hypothetical protein